MVSSCFGFVRLLYAYDITVDVVLLVAGTLSIAVFSFLVTRAPLHANCK